MERVLSLDLSSVCIGALFCTIDDEGNITKMQTSPIVPKPFSAESLGYLKNKSQAEKIPSLLGLNRARIKYPKSRKKEEMLKLDPQKTNI